MNAVDGVWLFLVGVAAGCAGDSGCPLAEWCGGRARAVTIAGLDWFFSLAEVEWEVERKWRRATDGRIKQEQPAAAGKVVGAGPGRRSDLSVEDRLRNRADREVRIVEEAAR